ncbi:hypothetical protein P389DRAFT_56395 [Cystobasidium minutum MCA 4210]|uniref:uncharacterized protein n=1 Tax=Cystobasidium minutum MCA 4210 TaxID=1397322 RepID=UPI0034CF7516|eukprot:jgi/Rhomi1/56395/CE56394_125
MDHLISLSSSSACRQLKSLRGRKERKAGESEVRCERILRTTPVAAAAVAVQEFRSPLKLSRRDSPPLPSGKRGNQPQ